MKDDAITKVEKRIVYDEDFKTQMVVGTGVMFVSNKHISLDFYIDELPTDGAQSKDPTTKLVDRRILSRIILEKDAAFYLSEGIKQAHRLMSGPMPEE